MKNSDTSTTNSERESRKHSINNVGNEVPSSNQTTSTHENFSGPIDNIEKALAYPSEIPSDNRKLSSKKRVKKKKKSIVKGASGNNTTVNLYDEDDEYRDESKTFFEKEPHKRSVAQPGNGESNASSVFELPSNLNNMESRMNSQPDMDAESQTEMAAGSLDQKSEFFNKQRNERIGTNTQLMRGGTNMEGMDSELFNQNRAENGMNSGTMFMRGDKNQFDGMSSMDSYMRKAGDNDGMSS